MTDHAVKVTKAEHLRVEGLSYSEIAARVGVAASTVYRWLNPDFAELSRAKDRARKESYRGTCVDCGAPTNGSEGPGKASKRCVPCENRTRIVWTETAIADAIRRFEKRYGRPPTATDFNPALARHHGHDWRVRRFYSDGDYPHVSTVQEVFGSWSAALRAAGAIAYGPGRYPRGGSATERGAHLEAERKAA